MLDKLLAFLEAQPDVCFPGHDALADWMLTRQGPELTYANRFFAKG
jgi:hypothetical protein